MSSRLVIYNQNESLPNPDKGDEYHFDCKSFIENDEIKVQFKHSETNIATNLG